MWITAKEALLSRLLFPWNRAIYISVLQASKERTHTNEARLAVREDSA